MKCRNPNCKKDINFIDWFIQKRCCVDCWMWGIIIPQMDKWMENPKNKIKFERWKAKNEKKD